MKMRCDQCIYWQPFPEQPVSYPDDYLGRCFRYPPQLDAVFADRYEEQFGEGAEGHVGCWVFPITEAEKWCGEYTAKH